MPIEITFVAENAEDLEVQILAFAKRFTAIAKPEIAGAPPLAPVLSEEAAPIAETGAEKAPEKPAVRRHRKTKPEETPAKEEASEEAQGSGALEGVIEEEAEKPALGKTSGKPVEKPEEEITLPSKELLALKEKVIGSLHEAFRAGKVQKVRQVLTQYGNGAKSFREIDLMASPDIEKALQKGALA